MIVSLRDELPRLRKYFKGMNSESSRNVLHNHGLRASGVTGIHRAGKGGDIIVHAHIL